MKIFNPSKVFLYLRPPFLKIFQLFVGQTTSMENQKINKKVHPFVGQTTSMENQKIYKKVHPACPQEKVEVELIRKCCPQHLFKRTARMKLDKETEGRDERNLEILKSQRPIHG